MTTIEIMPAANAAEVEEMRALFLEYARSLDFSLCFQGFDEELATLPGKYTPPAGTLLLALVGGAYAGGVGLRPIDPAGTCEMKRLYVRPAFRGLGLGRRLAEAVMAAGRNAGYSVMRLDTMETMKAAQALYVDLGFRPIAPYYHNPIPGVAYYECPLDRGDVG